MTTSAATTLAQPQFHLCGKIGAVASCTPTTSTASAILPSTKNSPRSNIERNGTMAAPNDQLALTRASRPPTITTSTRQAVPAFLNKLYSMVNNPDTDELVRWSDEGDSFYIPHHERLSKELLPRFFKHGNFSSFVRQLNMYGFHKVPHLQQGVLQNSTETELWQFQNPHFQRGQPDLLCLITRKKTGANADAVVDEAQHNNAAAGSAPNANQSAGALDMSVLSSSLAAVRKHQTSLSTEIKALQESNQHLWNEVLAGRDRQKKQQDTMNKILKFLASVFGNGATGAAPSASSGGSSTGHDGRTSPAALIPRKRPRLMIENGSADDTGFAHLDPQNTPDMSVLYEAQDEEMTEGRISEAPPEVTTSPAVHLDQQNSMPKSEPPPTPFIESTIATPSAPKNSPPAEDSPPAPAASTPAATDPVSTVARRSSSQDTTASAQASVSPVAPPDPPLSTPVDPLPPTDEHGQEQLYQEVFNKLLSSPDTLQRVLAALSNQGLEYPITFPDAQQSELAPYYGGVMNVNHHDTSLDPQMAYHNTRLDQSTEALNQGDQDINTLMQEWANFAHLDPNQPFMPNGDLELDHGFASIAPEGEGPVDFDSLLSQFTFPDQPGVTDNHLGLTDAGAFPPVAVPLAPEFDPDSVTSASFLDDVNPIASGATDMSMSPAIPLLDDFSNTTTATAAPVSPTTARFPTTTTPVATSPVVTTTPVANGNAAKRGRKRRSVVGEERE